MVIFLIFNIILFSLTILTLFAILLCFVLKKFKYAGYALHLAFLVVLLTIMIMSWNIIFMNGGFNVNFSATPKFSYDWIIIMALCYMIFFAITHVILVKKMHFQDKNSLISAARYLLPASLTIFYSLATIVFWFSVNCYCNLKIISSLNLYS